MYRDIKFLGVFLGQHAIVKSYLLKKVDELLHKTITLEEGDVIMAEDLLLITFKSAYLKYGELLTLVGLCGTEIPYVNVLTINGKFIDV